MINGVTIPAIVAMHSAIKGHAHGTRKGEEGDSPLGRSISMLSCPERFV